MTPHPPKSYTEPRRRGRVPLLLGTGAVALFAAISIGVSVGTQAEPGPVDTVPTGEINEMGMPVIETPGTASGTAGAGSVEVEGASWELGRVPLDTAIRPTWALRNTGDQPVTVGEPHPEVREGCCPGPFSIDTTTIPPGGSAILGFELSMHAGMDGWHDIAVHVPLRVGSDEHVLELDVTGDFRNT